MYFIKQLHRKISGISKLANNLILLLVAIVCSMVPAWAFSLPYTSQAMADFKTLSPLTEIGSDFAGERDNGTNENWTIKDIDSGAMTTASLTGSNYSVPEPKAEENATSAINESLYAGGSGTEADPYQIETWEHLHNVRSNLNAHFKMNNDLDENSIGYRNYVDTSTASWTFGSGWEPIFGFNGYFNGNHKIIKGLKIESDTNLEIGLFGTTGTNAIIANIALLDVTIDGHRVGGLVGENSGTINSSYINGFLWGKVYVGGLVGSNFGNISNSMVIGIVGHAYEAQDAGGLVGYNSGRIAYSLVSVSMTTYSTMAEGQIGVLVGYTGGTNGEVISSFWDSDKTSVEVSSGGTAKTTAELKKLSTYTDAGWDFTEETGVWAIEQGNRSSYPYLKSFVYDQAGTVPEVNPIPGLTEPLYAGGSGTEADPFQIETWEHLYNVRENLDAYFVLNNVLDETTEGYATYVKDGETLANDGKGWEPIGSGEQPFNGTFEGNGKVISGLNIKRDTEDNIGLFASIGGVGIIKSIGIDQFIISGRNNVGGIASYNDGIIANSYAIGSVSGNDYVGGLVGFNNYGIDGSFSSG
ncbi:hypothetical protein [Gracilimonas halophila]|uniref:The GLUG motif-containing protein n=1 Tax=Gracilimonas halophila TaxID=1834464 RepID=A0ABW5JK66_9BACT